MVKYLNDYIEEYETRLNTDLMTKAADRPLVDYIVNAWKSLEIVKNIKLLKYEFCDNEMEIDINKYIFKRDKKKKKKDRVDYKFIKDDRVNKLTVWMQVTLPEKDPKTGEYETHQRTFKKEILIPYQDENGNIYLKGKKFYLIYQLVEKSTYTSSQSVTLKSLMPVCVRREVVEKEGLEEILNIVATDPVEVLKYDMVGNKYILPVYHIYVFRKEIPVMLFYATKGLNNAIEFLGLADCVRFVSSVDFADVKENYIYFPISSKCYLEVYKPLFDKYVYIQSVVGGILSIVSNRFTMDQVDEKDMWIKKLGNGNNYEKGLDMLTFLQRLLDETTKEVLKVDEYHLTDVYTLLRWIMMNFNELRVKDNMDLANKRLRCNEYISALLTLEFSKRLNIIISLGQKATMENFKNLFQFPGDRTTGEKCRLKTSLIAGRV